MEDNFKIDLYLGKHVCGNDGGLFVRVGDSVGFITTGTIFSKVGDPVFSTETLSKTNQKFSTNLCIGIVRAHQTGTIRNFAVVAVFGDVVNLNSCRNIHINKIPLSRWWISLERVDNSSGGDYITEIPINYGDTHIHRNDEVFLLRGQDLFRGEIIDLVPQCRSHSGRKGRLKLRCNIPNFNVTRGDDGSLSSHNHMGDLLVKLLPFSGEAVPIGILWGHDGFYPLFTPIQYLFDPLAYKDSCYRWHKLPNGQQQTCFEGSLGKKIEEGSSIADEPDVDFLTSLWTNLGLTDL